MNTPPWSKGQMNKLGKAIADGEDYDRGFYLDVRAWHELLAQSVRDTAMGVVKGWESPQGLVVELRQLRVGSRASFRAKSIDTLTDKLRVMASPKLATVRDLAGVRVVVDGHPTTTYLLATELRRVFELRGIRTSLIDRNKEPKQGYRAIHLELRTPAGMCELQIRTLLQSEWATLYETAGDVVGRGIRYVDGLDELPSSTREVVEELRALSDLIHRQEKMEEQAALALYDAQGGAHSAWDLSSFGFYLRDGGSQAGESLGLTAEAFNAKVECMNRLSTLWTQVGGLEGGK